MPKTERAESELQVLGVATRPGLDERFLFAFYSQVSVLVRVS